MNFAEQKLITGMEIWLFVLAGLYWFYSSKKRKSSGLTFIFVGDLAINHLFGAIIYLLPWYVPTSVYIVSNYSIEQVAEGFLQTSYGLFGFFLGNVILAPIVYRMVKSKDSSPQLLPPSIPKKLVMIGVIFYFILKPLQSFASFGTLSQSGWTLMQVGVCLALWNAYQYKRQKDFIFWLTAGVAFFPFFTMVFQGFLGYAIKVMLIMGCFIGVFYRPKWKLMLAVPLLLYLGLTVYVNYIQVRGDIREAVWGGAGITKRIEVIQTAFQKMAFFDYRNIEHLEGVDVRLNQNSLVGIAVENINAGGKPFARGQTLVNAVLAMIPRIFWPGKPVIGGSGSLVADYTGQSFAEGTSVGIGFPLELYINFGTYGVVFGFLAFGLLVGLYDQQAGRALYQGDLSRFLTFFFPGLALTTTIGSLSEATSSFAAAYVFLFLINRFVFKNRRRLVNTTHNKEK